MNEQTCPVQVPNQVPGGVHTCGRTVVRNGMCGMHAAAQERRETKSLSRQEQRANERKLVVKLREDLAELGIPGDAYYSPLSHTYTGKVIVAIEDLQQFAQRVTQEA
jgi:hypothetical protein